MRLELKIRSADWQWEKLAKFLPAEADREKIRSAYNFSQKAHGEQKRESGDPYLVHPVWIAAVIAQLDLGDEAIMAALLHDSVENTPVTLDEISENFGDEVALLVSGLTEVARSTKGIELHQTNIEVFRNFLFSSVNDVRILIIRLVDKLHNGLTISSLSRERQIKYGQRVLGVYGPVAEYVGLHYFKQRLEDLAFSILYPDEAEELQKTLRNRRKDERLAQRQIKETIRKMLMVNRINHFVLQGRIKSLYSTYRKIKNKSGSLSETSYFKDRVGIRVIVDTVDDCYLVLGLLHSRFAYIPEEFDDYVSVPKPSGYRSLQTTLQWKDTTQVEVQIRTHEMHDYNEFGPASHIAYKLSHGYGGGKGMEWVRDLVKWQSSDKSIKNYRINVLSEYIYVFTPKGDVIQLPQGSCPIDFAYHLHSELGDYCKGVKINQKMGKINAELKTGDIVEILTGKKKSAKLEWLTFIKSNSAKSQLKKLRQKQ